jgi:ABC-type polysaccharide/polyol phosphate export permease
MNEKTAVSSDSFSTLRGDGAEAIIAISGDENASGAAWIRPRRSMLAHLQELWQYRELTWSLVVRDLKGRYKSSVLGFVWSLLNPLGMMLVFTVVFTVMMPNQIERFPIFLLCGLLPWNYFTGGVMMSTNSIVGNAGLVKKVYFPREVLPIATVLSTLVNFLLSLVVLFVILFITHAQLSPWLWLLPIVILIETCFILGIAFILSALNVYYRDTIMIIDVVTLAWFFLTPVVYEIGFLPESYHLFGVITLDVRRLMYIVNPMASLIAAYRDLLYWGYRTNLDFFLRTAVTSVAVMFVGYWFFLRHSGRFGEEL